MKLFYVIRDSSQIVLVAKISCSKDLQQILLQNFGTQISGECNGIFCSPCFCPKNAKFNATFLCLISCHTSSTGSTFATTDQKNTLAPVAYEYIKISIQKLCFSVYVWQCLAAAWTIQKLNIHMYCPYHDANKVSPLKYTLLGSLSGSTELLILLLLCGH